VLLHLIDGTNEDAGAAYETVRAELKAYGHELAEKPEIVALNKADALGAAEIERQLASLKRVAKTTPFVVSAVSRQGVDAALRALMQFIDKARSDTAAPRSADVAWQP
jgi:GTPase